MEKIKRESYIKKDQSYFTERTLKKHAGVWSLWALGVGAVISGHFSGWNLGLASGGWGGMLIATVLIATMYICLTQSIAEMSAALPHTGGAYSFARSSMGTWGGFVTGWVENMEFVLTPAVVVFFISTYMDSIFNLGGQSLPYWWAIFYLFFTVLNIRGVDLSFKATLIFTITSLAILIFFWISAIGYLDFKTYALDIVQGADGKPEHLPGGNGSWLPMGLNGALAAMPFAVWLFLAIEQLPLAAEESKDPTKDMPKGISYGMLTLVISALMILFLNASIPLGSFKLSSSGEPILDGFKLFFGNSMAKGLSLVAVIGLIASFHAIIFAYGRQIYSLSRAGYFPTFLSITHGTKKTPNNALITGSLIGFSVLMIANILAGSNKAEVFIGGALLNMAVFSAMLSYILQSIAYIRLKKHSPNLKRPYHSPLGILGASLTIIIAIITIYYQLQDSSYQVAVFCAIVYFIIGLLYFFFIGRKKLILSPEEEAALEITEKKQNN